MSFTKDNRPIVESKIYSGCGDGVVIESIRPQTPSKTNNTCIKRTPVPSSRRFATKPSSEGNDVKDKLEEALKKIQNPKNQHPKKTRRKCSTIAEITPTKRKHIAKYEDNGFTTDVEDNTKKSISNKRRPEIDAGRRLYKVLLLNAWRKRRIEVEKLTESLKKIQIQSNQLQIQTDVLHKLRESECKRRNETILENTALKDEIKNTIKKQISLTEDKNCLEKNLNKQKENEISLKNELEKVRGDYYKLNGEFKNTLETLQKERTKVDSLKEEINALNQKISEAEKNDYVKQEITKKLKEAIVILNKKLQNEIVQKEGTELRIKQLNSEAKVIKRENEKLKEKIEKMLKEKLNLETEIKKYNEKHKENEREKDEIRSISYEIQTELEKVKILLENERNKSWWTSTQEMFIKYPFALFKTAIFIMLPALSQMRSNAENNNFHQILTNF